MSEVKYTVARIADFDLDRWGKPWPAKTVSATEIAKMFDCPPPPLISARKDTPASPLRLPVQIDNS